jgi:periplasmic divalent cation tolerance protein
MSDTGKVVVLVTTSTLEEAEKIAGLLLQQRKAACINIVPRVSSAYWWQGKIEKAEESLLIIKTRNELLPELITLIKQAHSYTVPEIIALPIIAGNQVYLNWLDAETRLA